MKTLLAVLAVILIDSSFVKAQYQDTVIIYDPCPGGMHTWLTFWREPHITVGNLIVLDSSKLTAPPRPLDTLSADQVALLYPSLAVKAGLDGRTHVEAFIDSAGNPHGGRILKSSVGILDSAAVAVVRQLRFVPATIHGKQTGSTVIIPIKFQVTTTEWSVRRPSLNVSEISLSHIPGLGGGSKYDIVLRKNGTATYTGEMNVDRLGIYSGRCPAYSYAKLEALLGWYCFFDSSYERSIVLDLSTDVVSAVRNGQRTRYAGTDTDFDERIWALARLIDYIATEIEWVKTGDVPDNK